MCRADVDLFYEALFAAELDKDTYIVDIKRKGMLPMGFIEKVQEIIKEKQ